MHASIECRMLESGHQLIDAARIPLIMPSTQLRRMAKDQGGLPVIETLKERVNADAALVRRGRYLTTTFLLEAGDTAWLISIVEGRVVSAVRGPFVMPSWSFALRAP